MYDAIYVFIWLTHDVGGIAVWQMALFDKRSPTNDWTARAHTLANCLL
jgi:hypothetical protein